MPLRESVVPEEDIAAADDILDADEAETVKKTSGEDQDRGLGGQAQKHYRRESQRPTNNCSSCKGNNRCDGNNRIFRTQRTPVIFCRSQCAIDLENSGAPRQGCVHFAGSTRFDSRGQRLLAVYCIFEADPLLVQARTSSVSPSDMARGKNPTSTEASFGCLRWAWDEYEGQGVGSRPFDFSNM